MKAYKVKIKDKASMDIDEITNWYNQRVPNLGKRFQKNLKLQVNTLKHNPYSHNIRYSNVRCMLISKFPFLVHYSIDEANQIIEVFAIIHTSRSPKTWVPNAEDF